MYNFPPTATRPKIKKGPGRQVLDQDLTVLLSCTVSGSPLPSVTWLLDGKKIGSSKPRYSTAETIDSSGGLSSTLTIEGLRVTDGGRYTCEAGNRAGWDLKVGEIAVKGECSVSGT